MVKDKRLTSWGLHVIAMVLMLCDHLWGTVILGNDWLTCLGRIAFPIFAFMIAEGYFHTKSFKKYLGRIALFALISEIPFNLMHDGYWISFMQNVLWTFLLALLAMKLLDTIRKLKPWFSIPLCAVTVIIFYYAGTLLMVDYLGEGVLTVLLFYFLRGNGILTRIGQLAGLSYINCFMIKGLVYPIELFGYGIEIPQQAFAIFAVIPIWLYGGEQGTHNKLTKAANYWFYPVHMLILGLLVYFN